MRKVLAVAVTVVAAVMSVPTLAWAHSGLESSDPADGATLSSPPAAITMTFTEAPDPSLSTVLVQDGSGTTIQTGAPEQYGDLGLRVPLPPGLADGTYTVQWRVVATDDGHVTAGAFSFGVGTSPSAPQHETRSAGAGTAEPPSAVSIVAKALLYLGLMLWLASAVVGLGAFAERLRATRAVVIVAALAAVSGAALLAVSTSDDVGVSLGDLLASSTGRSIRWLLLAVLAATGLAAAWIVVRRATFLWLTAAAAAIAMLARVHGGHAAAGHPPWIQELLQWLHFAAAGTWAGGLVLLALLLRQQRRNEPPVRETRRYSNLAVVSIAVLVVTGLLRAVDELGGLARLPEIGATSYGTTLAIKVALALGIIAVGAVNRLRSVPTLEADARPLRRLVGVEVLGVVGVVALTATLTGFAPPVTTVAQGAGAPTVIRATGNDADATTTVEFEASPGTPGANDFLVLALRWGTEQTVAADAVTLRFASVTDPEVAPASLTLTANGDVWTGSGTALSRPGTWRVTVEIRSGPTLTQVPLVLTTLVPDAERSAAEGGPGQPTIVTTTFPDGASLQTYVDPGSEGTNQVHVTAFAPDGSELPLARAVIVAIADGEAPSVLDAQTLGPGHLVANADLDAGDWTFDVVATPSAGGTMQATWSTTIGPAAG